ncbi:AlpA family phage regulatory protein [Desulfovibrio sp.]|uniref:helix-turn-helix transcriptional regulator n=1 Tax=Desulfovibrio sp. TaxID=885 RepID=UPI0025BEDA7A|nr:AlpA family phage regulatory protein [Desulfovibrio sp.]
MNKADTPIAPTTGFLRLKQVLQFIPVGKTAWYAGIKEGRFPRPIPLGSRTMVYRAQDIADLIDRINQGQGATDYEE